MYAKDTSRKIKSALRTRKMQGKYMATTAPFGYKKDENDYNYLVIDEVTASVVELIFSIAEKRVSEIENLYAKLYEDMTRELITEKRFQKRYWRKQKQKHTAPPKLYDLTTLQRDANRIFGFAAKQTLEYTQSLYEKKLIIARKKDTSKFSLGKCP